MSDDETKAYALGMIRGAMQRTKLMVNDLEFIGVSLDKGILTPLQALQCVQECGALGMLLPFQSDDVLAKLNPTIPAKAFGK